MDDSCCTLSFLPYISFTHITKGGTSVLSTPQVPSQRRQLAIISILISHPTEGLILYETGGGKDYPTVVSVNIIVLVSLKPDLVTRRVSPHSCSYSLTKITY
jgi:hypothetical protein